MSRRRTELSVLFWTKVFRPSPNSCWDWLGATTYDDQGVMSVWFEDEGKYHTKTATHIAIFLTLGFWPKRTVKKSCGNSFCVNTLHMKLD